MTDFNELMSHTIYLPSDNEWPSAAWRNMINAAPKGTP